MRSLNGFVVLALTALLGYASFLFFGQVFGRESVLPPLAGLASFVLLFFGGLEIRRVFYRDEDLGRVMHCLSGFTFLWRIGLFHLALGAVAFFSWVGTLAALQDLGLALIATSVFTALAHGPLSSWLVQVVPLTYRRGTYLLTPDEATGRALSLLPSDEEGVILGGILHPLSLLLKTHVLCIGTTRSGKTVTLKIYWGTLLPRFLHANQGHRAIALDLKGELLPFFRSILTCPVQLSHPFHAEGLAWRMARDVAQRPEIALEIANCLCPENKEEKNPYFSEAARAIIAAVMNAFNLLAEAQKKEPRWRLGDILFACRSPERLGALLRLRSETRHVVAQHFFPPTTFANVFSTIDTHLHGFESIAVAYDLKESRGETFSLTDWMEGPSSLLVLGHSDEVPSQMDALNSLLFKRMSDLLLNQAEPVSRFTFVLLDEVREARKLEGLRRLLNRTLSKRVQCSGGYQQKEGMDAEYGKDISDEIAGECSNRVYLKLTGDASCSFAAREIGTAELEDAEGRRVTEYAVLPDEIKNLPLPGPGAGLHLYGTSPYVGSYRMQVGWEDVLAHLPKEEGPGFVRMEMKGRYLRPWDAADQARLGLPEDFPPFDEVRLPSDKPPSGKGGGRGTERDQGARQEDGRDNPNLTIPD